MLPGLVLLCRVMMMFYLDLSSFCEMLRKKSDVLEDYACV
jgi:hypothetical protein